MRDYSNTKNTVFSIIILILLVFGIGLVINATQENDAQQMERVLGNLGGNTTKESNQKVSEGIEKGKAAANYDFAMEYYPNDPVKRLTFLTEQYLEDGMISDAEEPYLQKATKQAQDYVESLSGD
ncbi:MAG: hypothetical protein IJ438_01030 [Clostridia bacterium]|nr:hypothetical protein [Clostridia bacterium]MBQ8554431.1 hypothetical protein [Clostridia bacterium]